MADSFDKCLAITLRAEGGWSNNPSDSGGCTMLGVTLPAYCEWKRNPKLTCADLHMISMVEVHDFYHTTFWQRTMAEDLPLGVDLMVFDAAVNMGVSRSVRLLQIALGVIEDGAIGPVTIAAALDVEPLVLINLLALRQTAFYRSLENYTMFGNGWINRLHTRRAAAVAMMSIS
jgi:lysozyme family protein